MVKHSVETRLQLKSPTKFQLGNETYAFQSSKLAEEVMREATEDM